MIKKKQKKNSLTANYYGDRKKNYRAVGKTEVKIKQRQKTSVRGYFVHTVYREIILFVNTFFCFNTDALN